MTLASSAEFFLSGGSIIFVPIYFILGYLISSFIKRTVDFPMYISHSQFVGLLISKWALLLCFILIGYVETYVLLHSVVFSTTIVSLDKPVYTVVALAKAGFFFLGWILPEVLIRRKNLPIFKKNEETHIPGWYMESDKNEL